jgi:DNA-binding SARP family transcriptional activator
VSAEAEAGLGRAEPNPWRHPASDSERIRDRSELTLLGGFVFSVGGDALLGISAASQRLLAFLALRDRTLMRHQVAGTLWPESSEARAGGRLRSAVSRLEGSARQAVKVTAADLGLAEGVVVDVHRSEALARRLIDRDAPPSDDDIGAGAVSALSDDLLPGWYDDWAVIEAEDWRQLRLHALEAVASRLTAADRLAEAAAAALAAVRAEPLRESARAALISVHLAEGNQSEALGELERYRVLLDADLGIEPTSRLSRLLSDLERR